MNRLKLLLATFVVAVLTFGVYSCVKEESKSGDNFQNLVIKSRTSAEDCSPENLYTDISECDSEEKYETITFETSNTLYSNGSELYNLCPGLSIDVSYTYTSCVDDQGNPIHFIHNFEFDIEAIKASCPAFAEKLAEQMLTNNHVSFLDRIESDISKQVEFTEAYNEILTDPSKYYCGTGTVVFSIKFIRNTCYQWGIGEIWIPEVGIEYFFTKEDCGESVCCSRSGSYCYGGESGSEIGLIGAHEFNTTSFGNCPIECTNECGNPSAPGGGTGI